MVALERTDDSPTDDQIVILHDFTWEDFERLLERRGDHAVPRMAYLEGEIELMSPSFTHEQIKSRIGRLVEVFCEVQNVALEAVGAWTLKEKGVERGAEPDECYVIGARDIDPDDETARPDLAIEVIWTSGRLDKLEIYRKLGVREVWIWRLGKIAVYALRGDQYADVDKSEVLAGIDLEQLSSFLKRKTLTDAKREYRAALQAK